MFIKEVPIERSELEIELQTIAARYGYSPEILTSVCVDDSCFITMEDLKADCLANIYGEDHADIPYWIWHELRIMITTLFEQEGIEYLDITPYNCIEKDGKVYLIDFGDAKYTSPNEEVNWFLIEFMYGENSWNPDYK